MFLLSVLCVEENTGETVLDGVRTSISAGLAILGFCHRDGGKRKVAQSPDVANTEPGG